jgi:cell division protein FtsL
MDPVLAAASHDVALDYVQAAPRPRRSRGLTTFTLVMLLVGFAVLITLYISNVVAVDGLMMQHIDVEKVELQLLQERENLRAEINMLSSYNRVQHIAVERLGLVHANQQPYSLTVYGIQQKQP